MYTISLVAQKDGTGKTTLAINLAVAAEAGGHRAVLIDLDPQASAAGWGDHRTLDTAPHSESSALAAARAADLALIPLRPGILDLRALGTTADICLLARRPAAVVLNQAPPRGPMPGQAAAVIAESNLDVVPHRVGARVAFVHSLTIGLGVVEHEPEGKAAAEIRKLLAWVWERITR